MISAHRLFLNGFSTEDFDVIPYLSFDGDDGATPSYLNQDGVYTEHYDGHRTIHRAKYNEVLTPRFTLIKKIITILMQMKIEKCFLGVQHLIKLDG